MFLETISLELGVNVFAVHVAFVLPPSCQPPTPHCRDARVYGPTGYGHV